MTTPNTGVSKEGKVDKGKVKSECSIVAADVVDTYVKYKTVVWSQQKDPSVKDPPRPMLS